MRHAVRPWLIRLLALLLPAAAQAGESRLRAAMNIELQILDPHITTATVTRAFGYQLPPALSRGTGPRLMGALLAALVGPLADQTGPSAGLLKNYP